MPRILIFVVAGFIVLAGGAITVMQQLEIGPFAPKVPTEEAAAEEKAKKSSSRNDPPRFVSMEAVTIPILQNDRIAATIQIEIQLETTQSRESQLSKQMPRLTDAFITDLKVFVPRHLRDNPQVDTEVLKKRLAIIGERAIGKGLFDAVLIQNVLERKV